MRKKHLIIVACVVIAVGIGTVLGHRFMNTKDIVQLKEIAGLVLEKGYDSEDTDGRAERILNYMKAALEKIESIELWHVWLMDYYEYEDSPVIKKRTISIGDMTIQDIKEINNADIWNSPDKQIPSRPSFYCLKITR